MYNESRLIAGRLLYCMPGMARSNQMQPGRLWWSTERLEGVTPLRTLMMGTVSRTARVSAAKRNLKEAVSKTPARRTGSAYEAAISGRDGNNG